MKLSMYLGTHVDYSHFFRFYVKFKLYDYVRLNLSETKSKDLEKYLKDNFNISMTIKQILDFAFRNMQFDNSRGTYKMYINPSVTIPNSYIKLDTVLKLFEYGNLEVKGLGLFTKGRDYIVKNISKLYGQYERIGR